MPQHPRSPLPPKIASFPESPLISSPPLFPKSESCQSISSSPSRHSRNRAQSTSETKSKTTRVQCIRCVTHGACSNAKNRRSAVRGSCAQSTCTFVSHRALAAAYRIWSSTAVNYVISCNKMTQRFKELSWDSRGWEVHFFPFHR